MPNAAWTFVGSARAGKTAIRAASPTIFAASGVGALAGERPQPQSANPVAAITASFRFTPRGTPAAAPAPYRPAAAAASSGGDDRPDSAVGTQWPPPGS